MESESATNSHIQSQDPNFIFKFIIIGDTGNIYIYGN